MKTVKQSTPLNKVISLIPSPNIQLSATDSPAPLLLPLSLSQLHATNLAADGLGQVLHKFNLRKNKMKWIIEVSN